MNPMAPLLAADGYALVPRLVGEPALSLLRSHVRGLEPRMAADRQVPGAPCAYGDPLMDTLLEVLRPCVERLAAAQLHPTYSFVRVYGRGDALPRHLDRPACEVSLSLCLDFVAPEAWPLWIEARHGPARVVLAPGDAVVYRGMDCAHWREAFPGEYAAQAFLHYVRVEGPCASWQFDRREALSTAPPALHEILARSVRDPQAEAP
jgi:hypothetical protein